VTELDQLVHSDQITVTATGVARGLGEVVTPVDVLSGTELSLRRGATLGDTLDKQPGVASTGYGQGSSRPVIRGLGSDRVRILENSLDTGDVSSIGPDHAVSSDPLAAERIEVVRGPGTLLYGANALGGVVNIQDGRVPDRRATEPVTGTVELELASNADARAGAATLGGGARNLAWHLNPYGRSQDAYSSPAPRPVEDEGGEDRIETGTVDNSSPKARRGDCRRVIRRRPRLHRRRCWRLRQPVRDSRTAITTRTPSASPQASTGARERPTSTPSSSSAGSTCMAGGRSHRRLRGRPAERRLA
jgi:outer membrane receptor protein involved in Fe transport